MDEADWKLIYAASGMTDAKIIQGRLEAEGIPTTLKYEAAGMIYAITIDGLGEVKVLVPEEEWERARIVLDESFEEKDLDWERPAT